MGLCGFLKLFVLPVDTFLTIWNYLFVVFVVCGLRWGCVVLVVVMFLTDKSNNEPDSGAQTF